MVVKIIRVVKVDLPHIEEVKALPCVERIVRSGALSVILKRSLTNGNCIVKDGEYLCLFDNGMWQRFGKEALQRLVREPRENKTW